MDTRDAMLGSVLLSVAALSLPAPSVCYSTDETRSTRGPTLQGDIDGDARADVVWTEAEWLDARHCRASLVVQTRNEIFRTPLVSDPGLLAPPGLAGLVHVDRRPGLEIAVVPTEGASTTFVAVYALRPHGLVLLESPLFGHGGSVGNRSGVDCIRKRGAIVVATGASYARGGRYRVGRSFYGLRGNTFVLKFTERYRVPDYGGLSRFPELANEMQPFPSCTVVS